MGVGTKRWSAGVVLSMRVYTKGMYRHGGVKCKVEGNKVMYIIQSVGRRV